MPGILDGCKVDAVYARLPGTAGDHARRLSTLADAAKSGSRRLARRRRRLACCKLLVWTTSRPSDAFTIPVYCLCIVSLRDDAAYFAAWIEIPFHCHHVFHPVFYHLYESVLPDVLKKCSRILMRSCRFSSFSLSLPFRLIFFRSFFSILFFVTDCGWNSLQ